jgi:hypothetical protein
VHWVRSEPCLSKKGHRQTRHCLSLTQKKKKFKKKNPSYPGRKLLVRTLTQSVRRPGIILGNSIVTEAGYAAINSCQQATGHKPNCATELNPFLLFLLRVHIFTFMGLVKEVCRNKYISPYNVARSPCLFATWMKCPQIPTQQEAFDSRPITARECIYLQLPAELQNSKQHVNRSLVSLLFTFRCQMPDF